MSSSLVDRLAAHDSLSSVPRSELEWLTAHGTLRTFEAGEVLYRPGSPIEHMWVMLSGRMVIRRLEGGPRKVMEWSAGDVTGHFPYSRMRTAIGQIEIEEPAEMLAVHQDLFPDVIRECHHLTSLIVHLMLDRARHFTKSQLQADKMASLGRLAAGLAHELNNPASAVVRSAADLKTRLAEHEAAFQALGEARLSPEALEAFARAAGRCAARPGAVETPLQRADREDELADWLEARGSDASAVDLLTESAVCVDDLNALEAALDPSALQPVLRALVSGCSVRMLAGDIENAASRVHNLVAAVKGFTYMDQAETKSPVDVQRGLANTLAVLKSKARGRSVELRLDVDGPLPPVDGFGGELNQVWGNLIDNAIDAAPEGGHVQVTAARHGDFLAVRVTDDGPGIPEAIRDRLFEPFFTTKPVGEGSGLGLDIVQRLIHQHEGGIEVESEPGRTVFCVRLPIAKETNAEAAGPPAPKT